SLFRFSFFIVCCYCYLFFFFSSRRRHTRFSRDWSSDVCSSDLHSSAARQARWIHEGVGDAVISENVPIALPTSDRDAAVGETLRSEERRVGKECRCGGARGGLKKKRSVRG